MDSIRQKAQRIQLVQVDEQLDNIEKIASVQLDENVFTLTGSDMNELIDTLSYNQCSQVLMDDQCFFNNGNCGENYLCFTH